MITICCMCKKVLKGVVTAGSNADQNRKISHGYCPDCYQKMMKQFKTDIMQCGPSYKSMMNCPARSGS